ncbi:MULTISPECIES: hypothetical protein [unclassified Rhizobacter]|uniref:hypothetical protein n=1 Tax=unclassified Rhizobacter TaxID=2640088 RepID=UPI0012F89634|nr:MULTISPECIES: hypothetical protein [unclassified Rhizobacter]
MKDNMFEMTEADCDVAAGGMGAGGGGSSGANRSITYTTSSSSNMDASQFAIFIDSCTQGVPLCIVGLLSMIFD